MILQALTRYYDILSGDPESGVAPEGYSSGNVSFALNLSPDGELLDIFRLFKKVQRGKKEVEVPLRMNLPQQVIRSSGISSNFLWDNSVYVLGLAAEEKLLKDPLHAVNRYKAFKEWNQNLLSQANCPAARAVSAFLDSHNPETVQDNPVINKYLPDILTGNVVFKLDGQPGFVHDDPEIRRVWDEFKSNGQADYTGQCLITGEIGPISRLHPGLKGVKDSNTTGAPLVGFNARAYESYNRTNAQGLNSPVSQKATFAYTTTLNYLLSSENENKKFYVGDTTVVYWAESPDKTYASLFSDLFGLDLSQGKDTESESATLRDKTAELRLREIAERIRQGRGMDTQNLLGGLDPNTRFYVLGLAPNVARIAVRFFYCDPFYKMIEKIMLHYSDLRMVRSYENQAEKIPLWQLVEETVSKKSSDKMASPLMAGSIMRAILNGTPYPAALYYAIINRIRADADDSSKQIEKINHARAAIIKAYLTRKYRFQNPNLIPEELCMSLNEQSTNPAYLLGRLFAVLEKAQQEAASSKLNATIKDRYFTTACASPSTVFPVLLRLAQHHISKAEYGYTSDKRIEDIMAHLEVDEHPFPSHLTLDEQGIFVLGYYHQRTAFYIPKADRNAVETAATETK